MGLVIADGGRVEGSQRHRGSEGLWKMEGACLADEPA